MTIFCDTNIVMEFLYFYLSQILTDLHRLFFTSNLYFDHGSTQMIFSHADFADHADFRRTRIIGAARAETQARLMSLPSRDDNGRSQSHESHEYFNYTSTTDDTDSHGKVKTKTNGIIIPPKDSEALYEAMKMMVTDDNMREAMAKNARQMIESRFEQGFVRKCLYDFYEDILDS